MPANRIVTVYRHDSGVGAYTRVNRVAIMRSLMDTIGFIISKRQPFDRRPSNGRRKRQKRVFARAK